VAQVVAAAQLRQLEPLEQSTRAAAAGAASSLAAVALVERRFRNRNSEGGSLMAHFAQSTSTNIVREVIVISNADCGGGDFPAIGAGRAGIH
jgi:hypothetical protein